MRFLFLNQFFPPDPAPTGVLLAELAERLEQAGHTVEFVAARQNYRGAQGKAGRLRREITALAAMLFDGLRRSRADVVLSASSPPCLLLLATLIALWHRAKSVHWIMDLYPEIAVALGEVRPGFFANLIKMAMRWGYRRAAHVVALDEDMAARLGAYGVRAEVIPVWVFSSVLRQLPVPDAEPEAPWTWVYSGNLGRAHEWETLLQAQALLEKRGLEIVLLFQGGGRARPAAQARAVELKLQQVRWTDYVEEQHLPESLCRRHVLVVTQLSETKGLLFPSKMRLAMSLPRPLLWVGPMDGAVAAQLETHPAAGLFAPGQAQEIAAWLAWQKASGAVPPARPAFDPSAHRERALGRWLTLLTRENALEFDPGSRRSAAASSSRA